MDRTVNIGGAIIHQVECNMFFKGHIERVRMDMCNLRKTEVILGMLWLAAVKNRTDRGQRSRVITRSILWNRYTALLWRIDST